MDDAYQRLLENLQVYGVVFLLMCLSWMFVPSPAHAFSSDAIRVR